MASLCAASSKAPSSCSFNSRACSRIGDQAGVLARRAAKAAQRVAGDVVAALHRDVLDRVGHVADRDLDEPFGNLFAAAAITDFPGENREFFFHRLRIELLTAVFSKNLREVFRLDL